MNLETLKPYRQHNRQDEMPLVPDEGIPAYRLLTQNEINILIPAHITIITSGWRTINVCIAGALHFSTERTDISKCYSN